VTQLYTRASFITSCLQPLRETSVSHQLVTPKQSKSICYRIGLKNAFAIGRSIQTEIRLKPYWLWPGQQSHEILKVLK